MFFSRVWNCWRSVFLGKSSLRGGPSTGPIKRQGTGNNNNDGFGGPVRKNTRGGGPLDPPGADNQVKRALKIYPEHGQLEILGADKDGKEGSEIDVDKPMVITGSGKEGSDVEVSFRDSGTDSIDEKGRGASGQCSPHLFSKGPEMQVLSETEKVGYSDEDNEDDDGDEESGRKSTQFPIPIFNTSKYCIRKGYVKQNGSRKDVGTNSTPSDGKATDLSISDSIQANHQCHSETEGEGIHYEWNVVC